MGQVVSGKMNNKGFTLVELLVSLFIFSILMSGVYVTYTSLYSDYKMQASGIQSEVEKLVGLNLLRLDIEHAGYGISDNATALPIEKNSDNLTVRSVINATNNQTYGWSLIEYTGSSWNLKSGDSDSNIPSAEYVVLNASDKSFVADGVGWGAAAGMTTGDRYVAFPYKNVTSGCTTQFCNIIEYSLSNYSLPSNCNTGNYNLIRKVGGGTGSHIVDCVAGMEVRFDYDSDNSSGIEDDERNQVFSGSWSAEDIRRNLKSVNVYLLVQEGNIDRDFNFDDNNQVDTSIPAFIYYNDNSTDTDCDPEDICLELPSDYKNYRWNPVSIKVNPMNL